MIRSLKQSISRCVRVAPSYGFVSPSTCLSFNRLHWYEHRTGGCAHMLVVYVFVSEEVIVDATLAICSIAAR